ncbi:phosphate acyltransferase [Candidatus Omnitrophota bacterium]
MSKEKGIDLNGAEVIDTKKRKKLDEYIALYCEIRKHKKIKEDDARKLIIHSPVFYSALAVRSGDFDGFVAGASTTTRDVAKAAIYCIGPAEYTPTISSSTILVLSDKGLGSKGVFILADAGIIPDPTAQQLADIAISSARMARMLLEDEPKVAMLSYSTKGSGGSGKSIEKVQEAVKLVIQREPDLLIDGEIQVDCAVVPEVSERKDPNSKIKGKANVFIFPNLDAGNISYKFMERLASAHAIGPILQGLKKPASDLSRGCDSQDIVDAVAITALSAANSDLETSNPRLP